jgi:hypothetical protein
METRRENKINYVVIRWNSAAATPIETVCLECQTLYCKFFMELCYVVD